MAEGPKISCTNHQRASQSPSKPNEPTLFFLDVGVGENVHSITETLVAGEILTTTPSTSAPGTQIRTLIALKSYLNGINISVKANRVFWTNMGVTGAKDGCFTSATLDGSDIRCIVPKGEVAHAEADRD
jgi:hypothetical protein